MKNHQPWHDRARELLATGLRVQQVADMVGKSDDIVRIALNINGAADLYRERMERLKARKKQTAEAVPQVYGPRTVPLTLPKISLPELIEDSRPEIRFAPKTRFTLSAGADRIRQIHLSMIRRGLIADRDLVSEWRR